MAYLAEAEETVVEDLVPVEPVFASYGTLDYSFQVAWVGGRRIFALDPYRVTLEARDDGFVVAVEDFRWERQAERQDSSVELSL